MDYERISEFERINVVGTSGSGKSTFSRQLAELLQLRHIEMDQLFWKPNWQESSDEEFFPKVRAATSESRWVLDGNYTRTTPIKWSRVQLVIWLDLSFARTVYRVSKRAVRRSVTRQELWPGTGNVESFRRSFLSRDSVIWWAMKTHAGNRRRYSDVWNSSEYAHARFLRLSSPRQVASCLDGVRYSVQKRAASRPCQPAARDLAGEEKV